MRELGALVAVVLVVGLCGVLGFQYLAGELEQARVERLSAQAELERVRSDRILVAAQASSERASAARLNSDQAHRQFLELVPVLLVVAGCVALAGLAVFLVWYTWYARMEQRWISTTPAALPPVVHILVLPVPAAESRGEYWRQVSAAVDGRVRELERR